MSFRVTLPDGTPGWYMGDRPWEEGDSEAIAPLEHCDDGGNLILGYVGALTQDSLAHAYADGAVMRYGELLCTCNELGFPREGEMKP